MILGKWNLIAFPNSSEEKVGAPDTIAHLETIFG